MGQAFRRGALLGFILGMYLWVPTCERAPKEPPRPCKGPTHEHKRRDFRHRVVEIISATECEIRIMADLEEKTVIAETYPLDAEFYVVRRRSRLDIEVVGRVPQPGQRGDILYCEVCKTVFGLLLL